VHTPGTPLAADTPPLEFSSRSTIDGGIKKLAEGLVQTEQDDGWTLHAISVSLGCFKIGLGDNGISRFGGKDYGGLLIQS